MTQIMPLSDAITLQRGFDLPASQRQTGRYPVVTSTGMATTHNEFKVNGPGVVIGRSGSIGGGQYIEGDFWPLNTTLWVKDFKGNNERFVYYLLKSLDFSSFNAGAAVPTLNRNHLSALKVRVPNRHEQDKIADILGAIDEKIELNRKMNETLEKIGQALFRHYFIDNPEAEKWGRGVISDVASHRKVIINPGKNPDKIFNQYSIPAYDNFMSPEVTIGMDIKSNKFAVTDWSILVSKLNPATPRIWPVILANKNAICSTEFQVIEPKKYYSFVYFLLKSKEYTNLMTRMTSGTSNSHKRISPSDILNYAFSMPDSSLLEEFEESVKNFILKIDQNRHESLVLISLRDNLLPGLMSGRVGHETKNHI